MTYLTRAIEQAERESALRVGHDVPPPITSEVTVPVAEPLDAVPADVVPPVEEHLVSLLQPASEESEQYRTLRHFVEQARRPGLASVIGVSSARAGDGKTLTAINLAGALAQAPGARVLLLDFDLRKPNLASHLGLETTGEGLIQALLNPKLPLEQVVQRCPMFNLAVLPSHRPVSATYELLKSPRCGELIEAARARYDFVVVDLPPLIPTPDCRVVEKWLDAFLVVVAAHKTPRKLLEDALAAVDPTKVAGLIFNGDDGPISRYGYGLPADTRKERTRRFFRGRRREQV